MKRAGPTSELRRLQQFVAKLEVKFLRTHLATTATLAPPREDEIFDVASYVVLAHGAIENFVEGVSYWVLERLEVSWRTKRRATRCTASLLLFQPIPSGAIADATTVYDTLRLALVRAKTEVSNKIAANNGITSRHVDDLLRPLGIDVPRDPVLTGSLDLLVKVRHEWAHQFRFGAKTPKSARDVHQAVADCLQFAEKIANAASKARP